jgi:hypothetical protein
MRHAEEAQRVEHRAADQHAEGAEAVGQHAGEHAEDAPGEVLDGQREREGLPAPVLGLGDRLQPQAEAVADAHRERDDHGAAEQHLLDRESGGGACMASNVAICVPRQAARGPSH